MLLVQLLPLTQSYDSEEKLGLEDHELKRFQKKYLLKNNALTGVKVENIMLLFSEVMRPTLMVISPISRHSELD